MASLQLPLGGRMRKLSVPAPAGDLQVQEGEQGIAVTGAGFTVRFSGRTGEAASFEISGREMLLSGPRANLWRAPTDNDVHLAVEWRKFGLDRLQRRLTEWSWRREKERGLCPYRLCLRARVLRAGGAGGDGLYPVRRRDASNGQPLRAPAGQSAPAAPAGIAAGAAGEFDRIAWYGRGPRENYPDLPGRDRRSACTRRRFPSCMSPTSGPQENGARGNVKALTVTNALGDGLLIACEKGWENQLSFNAHDYSDGQLTRAKHTYELKPEGKTVLSLDYRQGGIGSNSCGPRPMEKYLLSFREPVEFTLVWKPYRAMDASLMTALAALGLE